MTTILYILLGLTLGIQIGRVSRNKEVRKLRETNTYLIEEINALVKKYEPEETCCAMPKCSWISNYPHQLLKAISKQKAKKAKKKVSKRINK